MDGEFLSLLPNWLIPGIMTQNFKKQTFSLNFKFQNKDMKVSSVRPTASKSYGLSCVWNVSRVSPKHTSILILHVWAKAIPSWFLDLLEIINFLLTSVCMHELVFSCMESVFYFREKFKERMKDVLIYVKLWIFLELIFKSHYKKLKLI